jgi:hypothetical protein
VEKLTDIKPGMSVNIVTHVDMGKEITDVRNAMVYDVEGARIILSQTSPPFTKHYVGKEITVTCLIKKKDSLSRIGFSGKIDTILDDYKLYSTKTVQAVSVMRQSVLSTYDIRMHYRVKPKSDSGISLFIGDERASLIDISLGGARFCHAKDNPVEGGTIIQIILALDGQKFDVDAKVVNVWHPYDANKRRDLEYVSVHFLKLDKTCSHLLSGKILSIERELLSKNL